jgi:hypothetical protein
MDQTPIYFLYQSSKTFSNKRGAKGIHMRKSTDDTRRATVALMVTASGKLLPQMIIFEGSTKGRIVKNELPTLNPHSFYCCQKAVWMDEACMLVWVMLVLKKYLVNNPPPPSVIPILFPDSYCCHMMALVIGPIQDLGYKIL